MKIIAGLTVLLAGGLAAADLHVSPKGNDSNPGTREKPLASLAGARDAVRKLNRDAPITVHFAAGTYFVGKAIEFAAQDSGTEKAPVIYQAASGAVVRFTGGKEVTGWNPVTDPAVLARLPEEARGRVKVADLRAAGFTDLGKLEPRGFGTGNPAAEAELFFNDAPATLARWPNEGFRGAKGKENDRTVIVDTDRLSRWTAETDPWVFAYWHHDWAEVYEPLAGVDAGKNAIIRGDKVKAVYGVTPAQARWYAFNLLAELDAPGEYQIDRSNGLLYFLPPQTGGRAVLSVGDVIIRAKDLSHVTFRGFTVEACRGTAIAINGGEDCRVTACTIRNTGLSGVSVSGGKGHEVYGCDILFTGSGGISMSGGDRATLTPAGHNAENNHVHHFSRRTRTYQPAIAVSGVGNRIAHNLIHHGPHMALNASGNDHILEYNEIHNVVEESGDAGAYYVGRDWTQRGNILRYNYFHDIVGSSSYGGMTIYLDDQHCGHTIHGNLFERCMQSVFIGGGDDNIVSNNVFLGSMKSAHVDNRGMGWQKAATDDPNGELRSHLKAMPYTNELWKTRYPSLTNVLDDDPGVPKRNVFTRNISAGGKWDDIAEPIRKFQTVEKNLAFDNDPAWAVLHKDAAGRPRQLDFKDAAAVKAIGFEPLPLEKMGLVASPRRASWPVRHETRQVNLSLRKK
jgi:hypothetical protein